MANKFRFRQYAKACGLRYFIDRKAILGTCDCTITNGKNEVCLARMINRKLDHIEDFQLQCHYNRMFKDGKAYYG